jgi:hypothetical protein
MIKQKAEEEAAKVYEEFVDSFGSSGRDDRRDGSHGGGGGSSGGASGGGGGGAGGGGGGPKVFLRGGTVMPGTRQTEPGEGGGVASDVHACVRVLHVVCMQVVLYVPVRACACMCVHVRACACMCVPVCACTCMYVHVRRGV